jgi:uncharacterized protein (TIGR02147 family)
MSQTTAKASVQTVLREEFERRVYRHPRYSLRAFARDVGVSPSRLSEVLNGQGTVSRRTAAIIAKALGLTGQDASYLAALADLENARSQTRRQVVEARLSTIRSQNEGLVLRHDVFRVIADWYHSAILAYQSIDRRLEPMSVARRLGISTAVARDAIRRLKKLGLLKSQANGYATDFSFFRTMPGNPSDAARHASGQLLTKAREAIESEVVDRRAVETLIFATESSRFAEAKQ